MKKFLILIFLVSQMALGRNILVGDRVNLLISGSSQEEVRDALHAFEIDSITEMEKGRIKVAMRGYRPGKQVVQLGDKELIFNIHSSLVEGEDSILPDLSDNTARILGRGRFPWIFLVGILGGVASLIIIGLKLIGREKTADHISPRDRFHSGLSKLGDDDYTYDISHLTREYTDHLTGSNLLSGRYEEDPSGVVSQELIDFLKKLDRLKFARGETGDRRELTAKAREIVKSLEASLDNTDNKGDNNA